MATTPTVNASDEWTNASAASAATQQPPGVGWECSRVQLGHPVSLAVAPALDLLLNNMKLAFMLHVYGIACLFSVLATYTFFSLINLRSLISSRPFMTSINVFLCMLGASRAAYLMLDPYNLREVMPRIMGALLWDLAFPCLTSAFCLIQLAFLQLTKLKVGPRALREKTVPSLVIAIHFTFVLGINIILGFDESALPFKLLGETLFAVWACVLFASFVSLSGHVRRLLNRVPHGVLLQRDPSDCHAKGIMQLAMLAPYSNLASSVAAALVPTLLAPRLGQGDSGASRRSGPNLASQMARSLNANLNGSGADSGASSGTSAAASAAPPPVIKTEDVDAPTVMVRPATPTIMVCPGSRRGSTASLSRRGSSRRASSASLLRIAEEGSGPDCLVVDSSPSPTRRKKSLSWKGDDDVVSPAPEINQAFEATPSKSILKEAPAEDKTTAETKLLPTEPDNAIKKNTVLKARGQIFIPEGISGNRTHSLKTKIYWHVDMDVGA
ncbi:uncharacterized protein LOC117653091 [Thrips palmi]|uniref:Uncharacterized protein LOC117653091 n=1 Tax=Thrips palmi TaxID=161013 RepID=A0A6P9AA38_THRPL|nr:uncharacterized protein LOC117653091 [Thrips palmi]